MASSARIDELRKKFDENPRRYFAPLANEYRKAGDLEQAIFICQEYLPQQPGHMSGHIVYGQALFELSRFDEARAVFETALSLDPENLIALRHLGDIARQGGDLRGARAWYQRVLEADPRNEEIAQIMLTVLTTPHESQPVVSTGGTPLGTDVVSGAEMGFVSTADSAGFPVERSDDGSGLAVGPELSQLAERQPEPEPIRRSREAIPDDELLDLNEFSIGDVPMSSLGSMPVEPPPAEPFVETGPAFESSAPGLDVEEISIERTSDNAPFEADPYAIAAAPIADVADADEPPPLPPEAFATDLSLGLPDDGSAPSLSDAHASAPLEGVDSFSDDTSRYSAEPTATIEVESFFSAPAEAPLAREEFEPPAVNHEFEPSIEAPQESSWTSAVDLPVDPREEFVAGSIAHTPTHFATPLGVPAISEPLPEPEPQVEPEPEAFVTETMAELYLQQGHLEAALDIYQRLAEQRPGDERLRERMLAVADAIHDVSIGAPEATEPAAFEAYDSGVAYDAGLTYDNGLAYDNSVAYDDGAAYDSGVTNDSAAAYDIGTEVGAVLARPTIREFLSGLLQPRSFTVAQEFAQRAPTPVSTEAFDDAPLDAPDFDQQMFGQTPAAFDEPVFDTSGYGGTPSYGVDSFDTSVVEEPMIEHASPEGPTFEESPYDARTLEIDMTSAEFQSIGNSAAEPIDSADSIDEAFVADANEGQREGASVEPVTEASITEASITEASITEEAIAEQSIEAMPTSTREAPTSPVESVQAMPPAVSRPTPSSSETVTGSIDALFSGADASTVDATAATTLAQAFASEVPETPPLQGMPAHRAADELSLDHVFKSNPAPRQEAEGEAFSFDQFFADDMNEAAPKPGTEPASSAAQGSDDIAQFNNWLNGLKKT